MELRRKVMRKQYSKPNILFESYSLSTNIAAGCEKKTTNLGVDICGADWGNRVIFTDTVQGCVSAVLEGSAEYNGLCYHNPSEDYNVFLS
jgi:hypothetical protein